MSAALFLSATKAVSAVSLTAALLLQAGVSKAADTPTAKSRQTTPQTPPNRLAPAAPVATRIVRLTNDSLAGQPFGAEPTVQELLAHGGKVVARKPLRNMYEAGQIDTILLVRHQGNVFEFYRAPEKDLLRDATIVNFQPAYGRRLRTRLEPACRPARAKASRVRIGDTERTNYVSVIYQSGRLSAVHVEPYVD
ncbi:hypothetical protein GCM10027346_31900 [Hymenobacter seoulensis]